MANIISSCNEKDCPYTDCSRRVSEYKRGDTHLLNGWCKSHDYKEYTNLMEDIMEHPV